MPEIEGLGWRKSERFVVQCDLLLMFVTMRRWDWKDRYLLRRQAAEYYCQSEHMVRS